jgi:mannose-6-phosphate isomerase-like protein (cupin superfamily)
MPEGAHALDPADGEVIDLGAITVRPLIPAEVADGSFSAFALALAPGSGSGTHRHHGERETFFVTRGEIAFRLEAEEFTASAGACISIPPGMGHSFRNAGPEVAEAVIVVNPGGLEQYFRELREVLTTPSDPEAAERVADLNRRYRLEFEA